LKFDLPAHTGDGPTWIAADTGRMVVVAASTHAADEDAILSAWPTIRSQHPHALLVLAPRHAPRFDAVARRLIDGGLVLGQTLARRSLGHPVSKDTQIALLDTIGELAQCYPLAQLCLMGGTWADVGGHNALEPLAAGCPVMFGPHTHQFPDLYADMLHAGAALCVNGDAIGTEAAKLLSAAPTRQGMQAAGEAFVDAQRGSAVRTLQGLQQLKSWPVTPMPAVCTALDAAGTHWFNSGLLRALPPHAFEPAHYPGQSQALATSSGRGQAHRVLHEGQSWVLRHYRRGGWVAKFNADQYPAVPTHDSRAMQEFSLLREMLSRGLPVPQPVAARCARSLPWMGSWSRYRADIAVVCIDDSTNLAQRLDHDRPEPAIWRAVGQAIAQMHAHQIDHTDLNCHNILINAKGQVWLIDFDKCQRRQGDAWKAGNLERLQRSLRKEQARRPGFHWDEADWAELTAAYHSP
jgi:3-deoxy-D-manno-octulosonic-acid transferase